MKQEVKQGQTDYTILILVRGTDGNAETGLAFGDIDLAYTRVETDNDVTTTDVAPADLASPALTDPHLDWGFLEVSATDHPGLYRLDIADAVFASGAWSAVVTLTGTGLEPSHCEFVLVPTAPYDGVTVAAIVANAITATAINADAITAAKIADDAISSEHLNTGVLTADAFAADALVAATFATDALAADALAADALAEIQAEVTASLVAHNLDHLCLTATAAADMTTEVADNTILSRILANGDTSAFDPSTDGMQLIRDVIATIVAAVITNAAGADIAADIIAMKVDTAAILVDTSTTIPDTITTMQGNVTDILADTNELQADWVDGGRLDLILDAIAVDVAGLDGDSMLTAAAVNAEVVDALATDTYAEHAGVPVATCSLEEKITWLFMLARNKMTQTAATATLRNDADSGDVATSTVSDNGTTATRGEWT